MRVSTYLLNAAAAATALYNTVSASPIMVEDITDDDIMDIATAQTNTFGNTVGSICGCTLLSIFAFGKVYWPGSSQYLTESTTKYWSKTSWNNPRCIFVPTTAKDVAKGVSIVNTCSAEFAIRGGGHMPVC